MMYLAGKLKQIAILPIMMLYLNYLVCMKFLQHGLEATRVGMLPPRSARPPKGSSTAHAFPPPMPRRSGTCSTECSWGMVCRGRGEPCAWCSTRWHVRMRFAAARSRRCRVAGGSAFGRSVHSLCAILRTSTIVVCAFQAYTSSMGSAPLQLPSDFRTCLSSTYHHNFPRKQGKEEEGAQSALTSYL